MAKRTSVDLSGKNAIVTGGGGVLCSGFARELATCGASVAVCDLRLEAAQAVAGVHGGGSPLMETICMMQRYPLEVSLSQLRQTSSIARALRRQEIGYMPR